MQSKQQAKQPHKRSTSPVSEVQKSTALQEEILVDVTQRALHAPHSLFPSDLVALQSAIGNHAVGRLVQQREFTSNSGSSKPPVSFIQPKLINNRYKLSSKPQVIQRKVTELPPIVIKDEDLYTTIENDANAIQSEVGKAYSFGSDSTTLADGSLDAANPIVDNAMKKESGKVAEDLQRLSEEMTMIRPLFMQWLRAGSAVKTVSQNDGINLDTPKAYSAALRRFGKEARDMTKPHAAEIRAFLMNNSGTKLEAATSKLSSVMAKLQNAKRALEMQKNSLQQATLSKELQGKEAELAEVKKTIETISTIITTAAKLIAAVAAVSSGANAALAGAGVDAQTFGQITKINETGEEGSAIKPGMPGGKAAGLVASGGSVISTLLEVTVFAAKISDLKKRIEGINSRINDLKLSNVQLQTANVFGDLDAANSDYEEAEKQASDIKQNLFQAYSLAGRSYDQHLASGASIPGAGNVQGPASRPGEEHSMEAILALIAQLRIRGSARKSFGSGLSNSQYMRRAEEVQNRALAGSRSAIEPETGVMVIPNIDVSLPEQGFNPSFRTKFEAQSLQHTVHLCTTIINFYDQNNELQTAQEQSWQNEVTEATGGLGH